MNIENLHSGYVLKRIDPKTKIVVLKTRKKVICNDCYTLLALGSKIAITFASGNRVTYRQCNKCYEPNEERY